MQQYCQCVSCATKTTEEKNYSTPEGEALAIAWCTQKARLFLLASKNLTSLRATGLLQTFSATISFVTSTSTYLQLKRKDIDVWLPHQVRQR